MTHYFLGTSAGYTKKQRILQRRTKGGVEDIHKLSDYLKREYGGEQVIVTKNGRSAISAGLKYYHDHFKMPTKKSKVIVNGFTCFAVVQGVKGAKMEPVYADIDKKTLNFTPDSLESVVTDETWAIVVQNSLGNMIEIAEVEKFAKKHHLVIIEDLAHCVGRFYPDGREAGTVGQIVTLSFGKEKSIDTINGGAVVFRDSVSPEITSPPKAPGRRDVFRAHWYPTFGMLYRKLSYIGLHGVFMRFLVKIGWVKRSADDDIDFTEIGICPFQAKLALEQLRNRAKLSKKPIREFYLVNNREKVLKRLEKAGYYFYGFWYEKPISPERYYKKTRFPEEKCPNSVFVANHIVNFPIYYSKAELEPARQIIQESLAEEEK